MCGITGYYHRHRKIDPVRFDAFVDALAHRGPDGRGVYYDPHIPLALGHRRLSILDLSSAATQPLASCDKRYWITFNGEIYNFLELRKELELLGYPFTTHSDTEVIIAAFLFWGPSCQLKFNGMWAFGLWDAAAQELYLSRDRFGVKPLHYYYDRESFAFASEMKAFLKWPELDLSFNRIQLAKAIQNWNSIEPGEHTLIKGIHRLLPGHGLFFSPTHGMRIEKWWDTLDHVPECLGSYKEQTEQFKSLFLDACRLRMRSDIPVGSALSGGVDSSAVLCSIALMGKHNHPRQARKWQQAFIALYPGTSQNEFEYAKQIIEHTQADPFYFSVSPSHLLKHMDSALFQMEEIFELPIGPWLLYKQFRDQGICVSIDGHGADELLGGYHHQVTQALVSSLYPRFHISRAFALKKMLHSLYPANSPDSPPSWNCLFRQCVKQGLKKYPWVYNALKKWKKQKCIPATWLAEKPEESPPFVIDHPRFAAFDPLSKLLYLDFHYQTLPTILRNFDRCSMAHGVEIRAPFLDWRLVTYAFALPAAAKISNRETKAILRNAMAGIVPDGVRLRTSKIGFASPMVEWFRKELKPFVCDEINSRSFLESSLWEGAKLRDFTETSYRNHDYRSARYAWELIQANRLIKLFGLGIS